MSRSRSIYDLVTVLLLLSVVVPELSSVTPSKGFGGRSRSRDRYGPNGSGTDGATSSALSVQPGRRDDTPSSMRGTAFGRLGSHV